MDIIWSLKLREAAAKSFEKDIDELAAAEEARFCVDLSPVKVRELCDKILLLPHQGLALLFCRYCFLLSPEDVESLFQVKNAKGRFRFFSRLLSACMGLEETQRISDASLAKACKLFQVGREYLLVDPDDISVAVGVGENVHYQLLAAVDLAVLPR